MGAPFSSALPYVLAYAFSVIGGHWAANRVVRTIYDKLQLGLGFHTASLVGYVERTLYTTALLMGQAAFIAVWLALKVGAQWQQWEKKEGRSIFNVFLIGNGVSIAYATAGAAIVQWWTHQEWGSILGVPAALFAATILLIQIAKRSTDDD